MAHRTLARLLAIVGTAALIAAACGGTAAPSPTAPPTGASTAAPTAAPTAVPTAAPVLNRPVEFVISTSPGGGSDIYARIWIGIMEKEKALTTSAQVYGTRIVATEHYERSANGIAGPAGRLAGRLATGMQALLVPDSGEVLRQIGNAFAAVGIIPNRVRFLGTGLWDDPLTPHIPVAVGGWYAGVDPELVNIFAQRFQRSYGSTPPRLASLAYDAVSLAIILGRGPQGMRFDPQQITNPQGFQGTNGLFRFTASGLCERGLSILEVTPTGPRVVAPAPQRFGIGF